MIENLRERRTISAADVTAEFALALMLRSNDGIVVVDAEGNTRFVSPETERMLGYATGETLGQSAFELVHPDDQVNALEGFESTSGSSDSRPLPVLIRLRHADGSWRQTEIIATNHFDDEQIRGLVLNVRDVTHSMRTDEALRASEERHRLIVELAREGIWMIDVEGRTTFANRALAMMLDTTVPDLLGSSLFDFMDDEARADAETKLDRRRSGVAEEHDFRLTTRRGRTLWTRMNTSPIMEHGGTYRGAIALVTDVTERRVLEQNLALAARRDPLTSVANRVELFEKLSDKLASALLVVALFVDLDDFKIVNDTFGHAAGDEVLRAVAARLCGAVRSADVVARVGGDEFVIVTDGLTGAGEALELGYRICDVLGRPFSVDAEHIQLGACVGVGFSLSGDADTLLSDADRALYRAKRSGRSRVELGDFAPH